MSNYIQCSCGEELPIPTYPHQDNMYFVAFPTGDIVSVTIPCKCGNYLTTAFSLVKIETIEEKPQ
jgi:hypothetical protein